MKKIKKRLSQRWRQFSIHPVTKGNEVFSICRYIWFNILIRILPSITYNWLNGLKLLIRKGDAGIIGNVYYGLYEFEESIFLLHFLKPHDLFLDVGANVGHFSLLVSGINKCKSIAIEPVPNTYHQLLEQVRLNKQDSLIETKNLGISNKNEKLLFSTDRGTMDCIVDETYINSIAINTTTIDSILDDKVPIAIKIDVEGYERFVLEGACNTLESNELKVIILELNKSGEKYNVKDDELFNLLDSYQFKPFDYNAKERQLIPLLNYNTHKFNTIFIRDKVFVSSRLINSEKIKIRGRYF